MVQWSMLDKFVCVCAAAHVCALVHVCAAAHWCAAVGSIKGLCQCVRKECMNSDVCVCVFFKVYLAFISSRCVHA